tara:strand:- start:5555 stop:5767 length:213 start_codon:yes stop_codon:yes gene_type:complete
MNTETRLVIKNVLDHEYFIRKITRLVDNHESVSLLEGKIFDLLYESHLLKVEKHMLYKVDFSQIIKEFRE